MCTTATSNKPLITVATRKVLSTLTPEELAQATVSLREKSKVFDPDNPNLWVTKVGKHQLWGILDEGAGPDGENVFTILFPSDY